MNGVRSCTKLQIGFADELKCGNYSPRTWSWSFFHALLALFLLKPHKSIIYSSGTLIWIYMNLYERLTCRTITAMVINCNCPGCQISLNPVDYHCLAAMIRLEAHAQSKRMVIYTRSFALLLSSCASHDLTWVECNWIINDRLASSALNLVETLSLRYRAPACALFTLLDVVCWLLTRGSRLEKG